MANIYQSQLENDDSWSMALYNEKSGLDLGCWIENVGNIEIYFCINKIIFHVKIHI